MDSFQPVLLKGQSSLVQSGLPRESEAAKATRRSISRLFISLHKVLRGRSKLRSHNQRWRERARARFPPPRAWQQREAFCGAGSRIWPPQQRLLKGPHLWTEFQRSH